MTVNEILSFDGEYFNKLSKDELKTAVKVLASASNKRLTNLKNRGLKSSATAYVERSGGKFSVRNKNLNQLRAEFVRAKNFLQSQGSTVKGVKSIQKETINTLKKYGVDISSDQYNKFWDAYEKLKELDSSVANRTFKYLVLENISEVIDDGSAEDIAIKVSEQLDNLYREREELEQITGVSDFFTIE